MSALLAKLREQWSKGGCAVKAFILLVGFIALCCLCSLPITLMDSAGLIPTGTPTIIPTSTPTATPSPTPFAVSLPQTVTTESGHIFTINKIETLDNIGDEQPNNGVFLVLLGILQATDESSGCAKPEYFSLTSGLDNSTTYEIDTGDLATAKRRYGYDYPGGFLGQCPDNAGEDSFIVFDIENSAHNVWFRTAKSDVKIGDMSRIVKSKTIEITPIPTLTPTPTLPPTATPTPDAYYTVSTLEISIFDEPNLEANEIGKVDEGKGFWVIVSSQDSMWARIVSQDGIEGWISMDSVDDESPEFDSVPIVTNTPTATSTPTETPTPIPTNTPSPSPIPPATSTPNPTATPRPIPTNTLPPTVAPQPTSPPSVSCVTTASVNDETPAQRQHVTVHGTLLCGGQPIVGVPMHVVWHYKSSTVACDGVTDASGTATCERSIGGASKGYYVRLDLNITHDGQTYYATTGFTPR